MKVARRRGTTPSQPRTVAPSAVRAAARVAMDAELPSYDRLVELGHGFYQRHVKRLLYAGSKKPTWSLDIATQQYIAMVCSRVPSNGAATGYDDMIVGNIVRQANCAAALAALSGNVGNFAAAGIAVFELTRLPIARRLDAFADDIAKRNRVGGRARHADDLHRRVLERAEQLHAEGRPLRSINKAIAIEEGLTPQRVGQIRKLKVG